MLAFVVSAVSPASACIHPPIDYTGRLGESGQQAMIFWRDGYEVLILKVDYHAEDGEATPKKLAWVIPVPSRPDELGVEDAEIFTSASRFLNARRPPCGGGDARENVSVSRKVRVGEYDIRELSGRGPKAAESVNAWLAEHGFSTVPLENMKYYTERNWQFLAVEVNPEESSDRIAARGGFRPLRIGFSAKEIYYPLKFSSHQGSFKVGAYVFTEKPIAVPAWLREKGFVADLETAENVCLSTSLAEVVESELDEFALNRFFLDLRAPSGPLPEGGEFRRLDFTSLVPLTSLFARLGQKKLGRFSSLSLTYFTATVNDAKRPLAEWKTDFVLQP